MTRAYPDIEVCPHCDKLVDPSVHNYDAYEFTYQHADCLAESCWRDRTRFLTSAGIVTLEEIALVEHVNGHKGETREHFHRAECPACYRQHRHDGGEDARRELIDALLDCCDIEWVAPSDYVTDCDICGHDHRGEYNCTPPSHREPFPGVDRDYRCAACGWSGHGEDLQGPRGECPDCNATAVTPLASPGVDRGRGVATDGGRYQGDMNDWQHYPPPAATASDRTGPIIFSNETARRQLVEEGIVYTFRPDERTTGETHWRTHRTGAKQGDVRVREVAEIQPGTGVLSLFASESGFESDQHWRAAIRDLHEELPETGVLYRVEVSDE